MCKCICIHGCVNKYIYIYIHRPLLEQLQWWGQGDGSLAHLLHYTGWPATPRPGLQIMRTVTLRMEKVDTRRTSTESTFSEPGTAAHHDDESYCI